MHTLIAQIQAAYPAFVKQPSADQGDESPNAFMERFARFIMSLYETGTRDELKPAFAIAERGLASDNAVIRDAVVLGFLETLQNVGSHRPYGAASFQQYLGAKSAQAWEELNAAWKGKETLAEVVAQKTGASLEAPWWQFWRRRRRRPSPAEMLEQVANPELRAIIEGMTRKRSKP